MLDGTKVKLADKEFIVPPLNFKAIKKLQPEIDIIANVGRNLSPQAVEACLKFVHAALSRNYPDITVEELEDLVDMGNIFGLIDAVMAQSGFKKADGGAESGEA